MGSVQSTALTHVRGLLEVSRLIRSGDDLDALLGATARAVSDSLGFQTVVLSLYRPAWDDFKVTKIRGRFPEAEHVLMGATNDRDAYEPLLEERFNHNGAYLIPRGTIDWNSMGVTSFVPDLPVAADPDAWHPEDCVLVPMTTVDGRLVGMISVDEPLSGRKPRDDELELLAALARHAALAVEHAQDAVAADRHRKSLEKLFELSTQLTGQFSLEALFQSVCEGISEALGFENVALELADPATGVLSAKAVVGWAEELASTSYPLEQVATLLDPAHEIEGCYLVPSADAEANMGGALDPYVSKKNGRGPHAWSHHWLLVPLYDPTGAPIGMIWCDEPSDYLLPSKDKLLALRMFANQATIALDSAKKFNDVRAAKETLQTLVEASPLAIIAFDRTGRVTLHNEAATKMCRFEGAEIVGRRIPSTVLGPQLGEMVAATLASGNARSLEFPVERPDGSRLEVGVSVAPLYATSKEVNGAVCLIADVTDRKALDEKLRERQKLESIGILAGGVAHDFNNLLVGVLGNASLALADLPGDSPVRESLEGIELAARRAADLTQQLLAYSGQGDFVLAELDLSKLVEDNIRLLRSVVSKRTRLRTHVAPALPPVEADATHIRQVIMNLVTNASEAGDGGEVDIVLRTGMVHLDASDEEAAEWSDEIVPGSYAFIDVEDNAGGIAADIRDRIFDPFFSTKFTGRGLGLAATLGIVRTHRGVIKMDTVPGEGTTFRVLFPAASTDAEATRDARPCGEVVLVVDDEELVRKLVVKILKRAGLEAMSARSGEEALQIFADHKDAISAVILDTSLPGMGGAEVFDRLVAAHDSVRVIVSSGHSEEVALKGFRAGEHLAAYLQKPFRSEELLDAILNAAA